MLGGMLLESGDFVSSTCTAHGHGRDRSGCLTGQGPSSCLLGQLCLWRQLGKKAGWLSGGFCREERERAGEGSTCRRGQHFGLTRRRGQHFGERKLELDCVVNVAGPLGQVRPPPISPRLELGRR